MAPGRDASSASLLRPHILVPFLIVTIIWGSTWLVIRGQLGAVPPAWSICYRFVMASAGMFALACVRRVPLNVGRAGLVFAFWLGLSQFVLNYNFVYLAEQYLTSGLVALLYALLLIPNSLLALFFFRESVGRAFLAGSTIALGGVVLLLVHEYRASLVAPDKVLLGMAFTIAGILGASASNVMQGARVARQLPMVALLAWAMLLGAVMDGAWAWIVSGPPVFDSRPAYMAGTAYLALAGSVATFPLYFRLIQVIGTGRASYVGVLVPVLAMLLSTLFEGYRWSLLSALGALLALAGMVVAMRAKQAKASGRGASS